MPDLHVKHPQHIPELKSFLMLPYLAKRMLYYRLFKPWKIREEKESRVWGNRMWLRTATGAPWATTAPIVEHGFKSSFSSFVHVYLSSLFVVCLFVFLPVKGLHCLLAYFVSSSCLYLFVL